MAPGVSFVVAGLAAGASALAAPECEAVTDVIFQGENLQKTEAASAAECCGLCQTLQEDGCTSYSWYTTDKKTCYLHVGEPGAAKKKTGRVSGRMAAVPGPPPPPPGPTGQGCISDVARNLSYCDMSRSHEERAQLLAAELTMEEAALHLKSNHPIAEIPRLGLPAFNYRVEAVHGLEAYCLHKGEEVYCPTYFPIGQGIAATFNRSAFASYGEVVAREARIWTNEHGLAKYSHPMGISVRCPVINILRDPRWGRSGEGASECPFLTATFGEEVVNSMQQEDSHGYLLSAAEVKHIAVYNTETGGIGEQGRKEFNAVTSKHDLMDTYLPAFKATLAKDGARARGVMCSYNAINGEPACASAFLNRTARERWGFEGFVESDCDSVDGIYSKFHIAADGTEATAMAMNNFTDIDCGETYSKIPDAVSRGLLQEADVRRSVARAMLPLFEAGLFDGESTEWRLLAAADSRGHAAEAQDVAAQSLVLLKNEGGLLPLPRGRRVALLGPLAFAREEIVGPVTIGPCAASGLGGGYKGDYNCVPTLNESLAAIGWASEVRAVKGCDVTGDAKEADLAAATAAAAEADYVIVVLGTGDETVDEGMDLTSMRLSTGQESLLAAAVAAGRPTVVVLVMDKAMSVESWLASVPAVVNAFVPSGNWAAETILDALFGEGPARFGKLPYTMYPENYTDLVTVEGPSLTEGPGRTYRYYSGPVVFPFGFGLSTTSFEFELASDSATKVEFKAREDSAKVSVDISNVGAFDGDEVLMAYFVPSTVTGIPEALLPQRQLFDFERIMIPHGDMRTVAFTVRCESISLVDGDGRRLLVPGTYRLVLSNGVDEISLDMQLSMPEAIVVDTLADGPAAGPYSVVV